MFQPPFYYIGMPVNKDGNGPADEADTYRIIHEVWDGNCATVCECRDEPTARWVAKQLTANASPIVAQQQCGDWMDDFEAGNAAYAASFAW